MFVRWRKRQPHNNFQPKSWSWRMRQETIRHKGPLLYAYLIQSYRNSDGKPRHRTIKYLGRIGETHLANRAPGALVDFWDKANKALSELKEQGLRTRDIDQIRRSLSTKVKPPTLKEKRRIVWTHKRPEISKSAKTS